MSSPMADTTGAAERVANDLRDQILSGALPPGTPLRESALATQLGVSRNTLREGLRLLVTEQLACQQLYKGTVVQTLSADQIRDIYVVRRTVELRAIEESGNASAAGLAAVDSAVRATEQAARVGSWSDVGTSSLRFHRELVATLGSPGLDSFFHRVTAQQRLAFAVVDDERGIQEPWVALDREICDLVHAGLRASAARVLSQYLDDSERLVLSLATSQATSEATAGNAEPVEPTEKAV